MVLVELNLRLAVVIRYAKVVKQVRAATLAIAFVARAQVFDDCLGMHLFLQIDRWRIDRHRLLINILTAPDQLRVQIRVALLVGDLDRLGIIRVHGQGIVMETRSR